MLSFFTKNTLTKRKLIMLALAIVFTFFAFGLYFIPHDEISVFDFKLPALQYETTVTSLDNFLIGGSTTLYTATVNHEDLNEPKSHEIVMLLASDGNVGSFESNLLDDCFKNRIEYAKLQNYNFEFVNVSSLVVPPVWGKMPAILQTMRKYPSAKWIWWLDQDALIMNKNLSLQELFLSPAMLQKSLLREQPIINSFGEDNFRITPAAYSKEMIEQIQFLISQDHNGLNAGSFLVRNSRSIALLMDLLTDPSLADAGVVRHEQDLIGYFIQKHSQVASMVGILPQRFINAFHEGPPTMQWQEGDLALHFAGCWVENKCAELWTKYKDKII
ncbi:alpha-1,2-galactosyltransferase Gmh1 [Schizosaccharomyces pombe]|uniref:Probable alpha-1,2-galactosyltransferase gmh1 n=1 Tax=Schizosaccharomyces pombe (strain 972 / ATCC 24843) TaxID=284812 RepID=GMH1_SCHPO|nr:putative alpha-1,2-galactosyltransferase Gmh1 [Schizosaccharomyces pombe]Q09679.1 RecName: Full=Probable alpha-1,2-galactosyltransferase gmh1 [Schizosaccharomyces pombe 972h-]CAA89961.1 alpha-1,2-galactosyltransferase Gmh1 (predicted) [Schizosaccharomyces pombe]|eukprot:NP_592824.1 putative alpha-1,2-galactosyltransferase Gmh1 [Schizosaccharomyces pombe]